MPIADFTFILILFNTFGTSIKVNVKSKDTIKTAGKLER
jgi:hypothetical protein